MAAITQYLWEEHLRNSDVGQAAMMEAEREDSEHKLLIEQNEETNRVRKPWLSTLIFYLTWPFVH